MLTLNNLSSPKGAHKNIKRIGRGQASGQGTQAGKGHKGQKARKSGHVRTGFEGNNLPLYMRLPKRGFNNAAHASKIQSVTLKSINVKFIDGEVVSTESLLAKKLLKLGYEAKLIGSEKLTKKVTFSGITLASEGAKKSLEGLLN